jgi:protein-tyrosine phosphatase
MYSRIYWLPCDAAGKLAILTRPAGEWLADEVAHWQQAGVSLVVSLLERHEQGELRLLQEAEQCLAQAIEFTSFPIADRGVPGSCEAVATLAQSLAQAIVTGKVVGIHCRAGIGRSAIMAASILMALGQSADTALDSIGAARGVPVPDTPEQRDWIRSAAASMRGRVAPQHERN